MTYAGVRFSDKTLDGLENLIKILDIPNPVPREKLHCTLLYSKTLLHNYEPAGVIFPVWTSDRIESLRKIETIYVTLHFRCRKLEERFSALMDEHAPDQKYLMDPHITLSYKAPDFDVKGKNVLSAVEGLNPIEINFEYAHVTSKNKQKSDSKTEISVYVCDTTKHYAQTVPYLVYPEDTVLEVGCAEGGTSSILHQFCKRVVGIDISEEAIGRAKIKYPNIEFHVLDVYKAQEYLKENFTKVYVDVSGRVPLDILAPILEVVKKDFFVHN